jgi:hypothetical protein
MKNSFSLLLFILVYLSSCVNKSEPEIHLIPKDYTGAVIIIYDQEDGKPKKYEGDFRVYEIPQDGVLKTQFKHPNGFIAPGKLQYYYYNETSRQQLTYIERPADFKDDGKPHTFSVESSVSTIRYLVGFSKDGDKYYNELRKRINELFPPKVQ